MQALFRKARELCGKGSLIQTVAQCVLNHSLMSTWDCVALFWPFVSTYLDCIQIQLRQITVQPVCQILSQVIDSP